MCQMIRTEFDDFWAVYPRRQNKLGARRLWGCITTGKHRDIPQTEGDAICQAAGRYAAWCRATGTPARYIKLPTTWLNNGCWDDQLPPVSPRTVSTRERALADDLADRSWALRPGRE